MGKGVSQSQGYRRPRVGGGVGESLILFSTIPISVGRYREVTLYFLICVYTGYMSQVVVETIGTYDYLLEGVQGPQSIVEGSSSFLRD